MLKVGETVLVKSKTVFFGEYQFTGARGRIALLDDAAGACVEVVAHAVFSPHFWFPLKELERDERVTPFYPYSVEELEALHVEGRKLGVVGVTPLNHGYLKAWMHAKLRTTPDSFLYEVINRQDERTLVAIFNDLSGRRFEDWAKVNDTRPRRARISGADEALTLPAIKRPRLV